MTKSIDIKLLMRLLIKRWYMFVLITIISLFVAILITREVQPDVYMATTSISSIVEGSYLESLNGFSLLLNYSSLIESERIATQAADMLPDSLNIDPQQIQMMVTPSLSTESSFLYVYAASFSPQIAMSVSNAVAEAFVAEIGNITGDDTIKIYDRATTAIKYYDGLGTQRQMRVTVPSVCLFLFLLSVVLWSLFSDKVKSVGELERDCEISVFGVIPPIKRNSRPTNQANILR